MPPPTAVWRRCLTGRPFDGLVPILSNTLTKTTSQTIPLFLLPLQHHNNILLQTKQYQQTRNFNIKRRGAKNTERVLPDGSTSSSSSSSSKSSSPASSQTPIEDPKYPINENITITECRLVDEDGTFRGVQSVTNILSTIDRTKFHLVQVNKAKHSEDGSTILFAATCRLIPIDIYNKTIAIPKKLDPSAVRNKKKLDKLDPRKTVKELQISWAITGNDLGHRMNKMKQFLAKGNRVEVMIAGKKGMRLVPKGEMETVVEGVRTAVEEAGAKEWKKASGEVGKSMMMFFQGPLDEKTQQMLAQMEEDEDEDDDDDEDEDGDNGKGEEDVVDQRPSLHRLPRRRS